MNWRIVCEGAAVLEALESLRTASEPLSESSGLAGTEIQKYLSI
jgi:hypothetical protein